ncbi:hypothetical protein MHH56_07140 [Paenibacillus sp. FSL K6-3182]|uniref:hypothetical protein n=1 Tax=Paenibacillus sp. FSL K6-3182 TaxID=2921495 RepID=UPI0030D60B65
MELYFKDNFFNAGETTIMDANGASAGSIDYELIAVVMGVHSIQKEATNTAAT